MLASQLDPTYFMNTTNTNTENAVASENCDKVSRDQLLTELAKIPAERSAWRRAVMTYAEELADGLENAVAPAQLKIELLNGACDWREYSYGGCSLIYDSDIAERVCSPSELKRTRNGELQPNSRETWLDCQARALRQAASILVRIATC